MNLFNQRLKLLRKESKKTQQNIADFLKIRRSTYGEYERGKILPPMDKMKALADYFGVSVDYLINGIKEEKLIDVFSQMQTALKLLKERPSELMFDGEPLDEESRTFLIQSIENGLKMASIIKKGKSSRTT